MCGLALRRAVGFAARVAAEAHQAREPQQVILIGVDRERCSRSRRFVRDHYRRFPSSAVPFRAAPWPGVARSVLPARLGVEVEDPAQRGEVREELRYAAIEARTERVRLGRAGRHRTHQVNVAHAAVHAGRGTALRLPEVEIQNRRIAFDHDARARDVGRGIVAGAFRQHAVEARAARLELHARKGRDLGAAAERECVAAARLRGALDRDVLDSNT